MTTPLRLFAYCLYAAAILVMMLFYGREYDWIESMDGAIDATQIEGAGNRTVMMGLALSAALLAQGTVAAVTLSLRERCLAFALAGVAALMFLAGQRSSLF